MRKDWARHALKVVKTTLVGGVVFMMPVVVLIVVFKKAGGYLRKLAQPLEKVLPLDTFHGVIVADTIVIALFLLACFLAGFLTRLSFANRFVKLAETGVLWRIPGYGFLKALTDSLDKEHGVTLRPVLVRFDDYSQLAFEVDELPDGRKVIYIPSAPNPRAGSVLVLDKDRVEPVPLSFMAAVRSLRALGRGVGSSLTTPPRTP
jgi:uncharacterized membrane protein